MLGSRAERTIARILDATRQIFLLQGYAGTTIDDITRAAGISRASFYTYFPSKRDVLLALGVNTANATADVIRAVQDLPSSWARADLEAWVSQCFTLLDDHGGFAFAWTQAAHEDAEIRVAGSRGHLELCHQLGVALCDLGMPTSQGTVEVGLLVLSMLERSWAYCQLYGDTVDVMTVQRQAARVVEGIIGLP